MSNLYTCAILMLFFGRIIYPAFLSSSCKCTRLVHFTHICTYREGGKGKGKITHYVFPVCSYFSCSSIHKFQVLPVLAPGHCRGLNDPSSHLTDGVSIN